MNKNIKECCESMKRFSTLNCGIHKTKFVCPDVLIDLSITGTEHRILIHDDGSSGIKINYCPWCGKKLV